MSDEIMLKLETLAKGISDYQQEHKLLEDKVTALDEEKLTKMSAEVAKTIEELNQLKADQKALEKIACRLNTTTAESEVCSEAKSQYLQYFRRGTAINEEHSNKVADSIARRSLLGATEHQIEMAKKDLVVGSSPDGGYFVRPEIADFMIKRIFETSPMRQIATTMTISSESIQIPIDDQEASAGWVGEVDSRTKTDTSKVGVLDIHAHELYANPAASQKMIDDAGFDIEAWLQQKVSDKFSRLENTAFVVGTGAKQPRGFLDYAAWTTPGTYERGKLERVNSGTSGSFDDVSLISLQNALHEEYQPGSTWVMKRATWGNVMKLRDGVGQYLLNPMLLFQGVGMTLLGSPVVFFDNMPAIGADALAIAFGNFKIGYTIVDRIGIRILRDPYTNKPYIQYYTTKRVGGDVTNYEAIKILKLAV